MESAMTSVATPAATPITENSVTRRSTAGRYGERRYRPATNHSNRMGGRIASSHPQEDTLRAVCFGSGVFVPLRPKQGKENNVADRRGIREQHRQAVYADAFARSGRHPVAQRADVIHVELFRNFLAALCYLGEEAALLLRAIVQLAEAVGHFHPRGAH